MSESEVRRCIEGVSMNVGSMRYAEALREAARLAPVEEEELRVKTSTFFLSFFRPPHSACETHRFFFNEKIPTPFLFCF